MKRYRRSRFLLLEWAGDELVLVHCNDLRKFRVDTRLLNILGRLTEWTTAAGVSGGISAGDLDYLEDIGVVEASHDDEGDARDQDVYWNPFDLAVHRHSNVGGYREGDILARGTPPPNLVKVRPSGCATGLPVGRGRRSMPLMDALARRRSIRAYADRSLRLDELSQLLYQSARIVETHDIGALGGHALRPFASGGARGELELYIVANDVDGLDPGAYYYDSLGHSLLFLKHRDEHQERLTRHVDIATGSSLNRAPAVIILITAVFARVMWKYSGIGLGVIYKNTGCLYQTLYLVATDLGLAPCGIGGGEEVANSTWLGLDPLVESQVGCVLIGPRLEAEPP